MINVIKLHENKKEDLDKYNKKVVFEFFPMIKSYIFDVGEVDSGYWNTVR